MLISPCTKHPSLYLRLQRRHYLLQRSACGGISNWQQSLCDDLACTVTTQQHIIMCNETAIRLLLCKINRHTTFNYEYWVLLAYVQHLAQRTLKQSIFFMYISLCCQYGLLCMQVGYIAGNMETTILLGQLEALLYYGLQV